MDEENDENELMRLAASASDLAGAVGIPSHYEAGDKVLSIEFKRSVDLSKELKSDMMIMLEENVRTFYETTWGWDPDAKKKELFARDARFLIIRDPSLDDLMVGWSMFKFDWDDVDEPEHPVLYCFELQIRSSQQGLGIGSKIMSLLVLISDHYKMWKTMLTCFKANTRALSFYAKLGFGIDANSPSSHGFSEEGYEILSNRPHLR